MRNYRAWTDNDFTQAVKNSISVAGVLKILCLRPSGGNYGTVHARVKKLGLDTSHWLGQRHGLGKKRTNIPATHPDKVMVKNSTYTNRSRIKKILQLEGVPYECDICHQSDWLGKPLTLQLDHKNGHHNDNRRENLRFLCPNCHSQIDTFGGKNVGKVNYLGDD